MRLVRVSDDGVERNRMSKIRKEDNDGRSQRHFPHHSDDYTSEIARSHKRHGATVEAERI